MSNIAARWLRGTDLRQVGTGTVSGTGLARVAGARAVMVAGVFELAKGALGPFVAGEAPWPRALAGAAAVVGHNWSPWLGGAGGRGVAPSMGALLVSAPVGAALLAGGLVAGRLLGETALGCLASYVCLVPVARRVHGPSGALAAGALLVPVLLKRLTGNEPARRPLVRAYAYRLLFDRDTLSRAPGARNGAGGGPS